MTRAWRWLRDTAWPWLVGLVLIVLGAGWLWRRQKTERRAIRDRLELERVRAEVDGLRQRRAELEAEDAVDEQEVAKIDSALETNRQAIEAARDVGELTDEEALAEFERLGF